MRINGLGGHLGGFGTVSTRDSTGIQEALRSPPLRQEQLPELAQVALEDLTGQLETFLVEIEQTSACIGRRSSALSFGKGVFDR